MPQLFSLGDQAALGFRDREPAKAAQDRAVPRRGVDGRAGGASAEPVRVGRADGVGRPALAPCMDGVVVATPRTYGGDYFVGVNWLDQRAAQRTRGEQQFYEDSHAFTQVAVACAGRSRTAVDRRVPSAISARAARCAPSPTVAVDLVPSDVLQLGATAAPGPPETL